MERPHDEPHRWYRSSKEHGRIDIRFEPWDEVFYVRSVGHAGTTERHTFQSEAALQAWLRAPRLTIGRAGPAGATARIVLEVIPFSASEEADAKEWLARSVTSSGPPSAAESVRNCLRQIELDREIARLRSARSARTAILGRSRAIEQLRGEIERVAATSARVMIRGESGTGKELVATAIHELSERKRRPLVRINCAAIPVTVEQLPSSVVATGHASAVGSLESLTLTSVIPLRDFRARCERDYIETVLKRTNWNFTRAADLLQIQRTYLHQKATSLGIQRPGEQTNTPTGE